MNDFDVSPAGRSSADDRPEGAGALENILTGSRLPETEDEMSVAHLVAAMGAPGRADELASADATAAAFVAARAGTSGSAAVVSLAGRPRGRTAALAATAVTGVVLSVALVGTAAAAFTGTLPQPLQRIAHDLVGAPAPADDVTASAGRGTPGAGAASSSAPSRGPAATPLAPAVVGLCRAFGDRGPSASATGSTAYRALAAAAAARGQSVRDYCVAVLASADARPPGQTTKPSTPPGQSGKATPPGQTTKPSAPPGQSGKATPPGQTTKPSTPPGQSGKATPPGQTKKPSTPPGQGTTP